MGLHLFLSPHLDDAILSCGGVIHGLTRSGERVVIVTAMAGEPDETLPDSTVMQALRARETLISARRTEDAQAALELRAQTYHMAFLECAFRAAICGAAPSTSPSSPSSSSPAD